MKEDIWPIIKGLRIGCVSLFVTLSVFVAGSVFWNKVGSSLYSRLTTSIGERRIQESSTSEEMKSGEDRSSQEGSDQAVVSDTGKDAGVGGKSVVGREEKKYKYNIKVYFTNLEKEADETDRKIHVYPLNRGTDRDEVAAFSLSEMIKGPTEEEKAQGYYSEVVVDGVLPGEEPFKIRIVNKVAYVDFTKPLKFNSASSKERAKMQIEQTLTQFVTIDKVVITVQGTRI